MPGSLRSWLETAERYQHLLRWLLRDILGRGGRTLPVVLGASVIAVLSRAGSLGIVVLYVQAHTRQQALQPFGVTLPTDGSFSTLLLWGGLALALSTVAAASSYGASALSFRIARFYVRRSVGRIFRVIASGASLSFPQSFRLKRSGLERGLVNFLIRDMSYLMRVVVLTLRLPVPSLTLIVAGGVLVWLNALLTGVVALALVAFFVALVILNRRVVEYSRQRDSVQPDVGPGVSRLVGHMLRSDYPPHREPDWMRLYFGRSGMGRNLDAVEGMLLTGQRVDAARDMFQGLALLGALIAFGAFLAQHESSWAALLTYLLALGYLTSSLGIISRTLSDVNRFLPQIRRYVEFIQANEDGETRPGYGSLEALPTLTVPEPSLSGSLPALRLSPGEPLLYIQREPLRVHGLLDLCHALTGPDSRRALQLRDGLFFRAEPSPFPRLRVCELIGLGRESAPRERVRVEEFIAALGLTEEWRKLPEGTGTMMEPELETALSNELRYALSVLPGVLAECPLLLLSWSGFASLEADVRRRWLDLLADRVVMFHTAHLPKAPPRGIAYVLVADRRRICGIGKAGWYLAVRASLEAKFPGRGAAELRSAVAIGEQTLEDA